MRKEITEVCPHCDREVVMSWDVKRDGYKIHCPYCGKEMMLCDECYHEVTDDNPDGECVDRCNWSPEKGCFRCPKAKKTPHGFPSADAIEQIRKQYPTGTRLRLVRMDDIQAPPVGTEGTVLGVDDAGQIMIRWDTGSSLSLVVGVDKFEVAHPQ